MRIFMPSLFILQKISCWKNIFRGGVLLQSGDAKKYPLSERGKLREKLAAGRGNWIIAIGIRSKIGFIFGQVPVTVAYSVNSRTSPQRLCLSNSLDSNIKILPVPLNPYKLPASVHARNAGCATPHKWIKYGIPRIRVRPDQPIHQCQRFLRRMLTSLAIERQNATRMHPAIGYVGVLPLAIINATLMISGFDGRSPSRCLLWIVSRYVRVPRPALLRDFVWES